jgi:putative flippase GtrA
MRYPDSGIAALRHWLRAFLMFGSVGLVAAVFHYGTLIALCEAFDVDPVPASVFGFIAGGCVSYLLNYHLTFMSDRRHAVAVPLFLLVALAGLALNTLAMAVLVNALDIQYVLAQAMATIMVLFWHFFANARWTFASRGVP